MEFYFGVLMFVALWCHASAGVARVNCTDVNSVKQATRRCFSQVTLPPGTDINTFLNGDPSDLAVVCGDQDRFVSAMLCSQRVGRACLVETGSGNTDLFPEDTRMVAGFKYMCNNIQDVDLPCIKRSTPAMTTCAQTKATTLMMAHHLNPVQLTCRIKEFVVACVNLFLPNCGGRTAEVYSTWIRDYFANSACAAGASTATEDHLVG